MSDWFDEYGFDPVDERLLVGSLPADGDDVDALAAAGVTRVLSLVRDAEYAIGEREAVTVAYARHGIEEVRLGTADFGHLLPGLLERGTDQLVAWIGEGETAYAHCRAGWQRSATVAAGTLARLHETSPAEGLRRVREGRPPARPLPHQVDDLLAWWSARAAGGR